MRRRLHRDLRGLEVADFADHHHVRVLAQDGAQAAREGHLDLGVDLGLADAVEVVLDRVLDRHDVARVVVEPLQRRVQRGGLARAGRAGDQQDAVRLVDQLVDQLAGCCGSMPSALEVEPAGLLVEQAQHHALAVAGGDGRDAHVDRAAGQRRLMRPSCGRRFSAMSSCAMTLMRDTTSGATRALGLQHFAQHAVDAEAHHQPVLERLDVDVGGVLAHRLRQQRIDQADDRRVVVALEQVGLLGQFLRQVREVGVAFEALDQRCIDSSPPS